LKQQTEPFVVRFSGDCDISRYPEIRALFDTIPADAPSILVDLSATHFADSTCLTELLFAKRRFEQQGQRVAVLVTDRQLQRVILLANLTQRLNVFDDEQEALAFLRTP
jgi:anti-anti-sigma factor